MPISRTAGEQILSVIVVIIVTLVVVSTSFLVGFSAAKRSHVCPKPELQEWRDGEIEVRGLNDCQGCP